MIVGKKPEHATIEPSACRLASEHAENFFNMQMNRHAEFHTIQHATQHVVYVSMQHIVVVSMQHIVVVNMQ